MFVCRCREGQWATEHGGGIEFANVLGGGPAPVRSAGFQAGDGDQGAVVRHVHGTPPLISLPAIPFAHLYHEHQT
jgi:hypothetical protein